MIQVRDLKKSFGRQRVLSGLNIDIGMEAVALLGPNGAGKTTFLKCLLGLLEYEGEILIDGLKVKGNELKIKQKIGYVPQVFPLWGDLSLSEAMGFFVKLRKADSTRADELLNHFDLKKESDKKISELSGGMRQKLSIAIALLSDPEIILLDEPTANLDVWAIKEILSILLYWRGKKTILLSSHRIEEVRVVTDRIVQLQNGLLKSLGSDDIEGLRVERKEEK